MVKSKWRDYISGYVMILPAIFFLCIFTILPIISSLWFSLCKYNMLNFQPVYDGLSNYKKMFTTPLFWKVLKNTLLYSIVAVSSSLFLSMLLALLLETRRLRLKSVFKFSLFYPYVIPFAAASMIWLWMYNPSYGIINQLFGKIGLSIKIDWLNNSKSALVSVIVVGVWKYVGYYTLLFIAGLKTIDAEYYEASLIEGATLLDQLRHITLPLLTPTTFVVAMLCMMTSFRSADQIYVMTEGGPYNSSNVLLYYVYQIAFSDGDYGYGSAISFFLVLMLLSLAILYFWGLQRFVHYERGE